MVPEPPVPFISMVTQTGRLRVTFTQPVYTVPNLTIINNGTIELKGKVVPVLDIEIVPGEDSNSEDLLFTWEVVSQTATTLEI